MVSKNNPALPRYLQGWNASRPRGKAEIWRGMRPQEASALRCWYHARLVMLSNGESVGSLPVLHPCRNFYRQ